MPSSSIGQHWVIAVAVAWRRQAQSKTAIRVRLDDDRMTTASALPATASPQRATAAGDSNIYYIQIIILDAAALA